MTEQDAKKEEKKTFFHKFITIQKLQFATGNWCVRNNFGSSFKFRTVDVLNRGLYREYRFVRAIELKWSFRYTKPVYIDDCSSPCQTRIYHRHADAFHCSVCFPHGTCFFFVHFTIGVGSTRFAALFLEFLVIFSFTSIKRDRYLWLIHIYDTVLLFFFGVCKSYRRTINLVIYLMN